MTHETPDSAPGTAPEAMQAEAAAARPKVYIYAAGRFFGADDNLHVFAVTEDGEGLAAHVSSSMWWARRDLHDNPDRHRVYADRFGGWGDGKFYDLVVCDVGQGPPAEVIAAIERRNAELEAKIAQAQPAAAVPDPQDRVLYMFTIHRHPADHPGKFTVRQFQVAAGVSTAGPLLGVRDTLDEARALVPPFASTCLPRDPGDAATIVETWC